jgi:hypothetical protein
MCSTKGYDNNALIRAIQVRHAAWHRLINQAVYNDRPIIKRYL